MAVSTIGYVPNGARKIRASRGDGVALPSKGNRNSTFLGRTFADETPKFGTVVFGRLQDYYPTPKATPAVTGGVSKDSPRADRTGFAAAVAPTTKRGARRTPPPAGRRNSLSAMRRKG